MEEFDFIIGSLHLVNKKDPYYPSFWNNRDPKEAIRQYLDQLYENITAFHPVSYTHLTLPTIA